MDYVESASYYVNKLMLPDQFRRTGMDAVKLRVVLKYRQKIPD